MEAAAQVQGVCSHWWLVSAAYLIRQLLVVVQDEGSWALAPVYDCAVVDTAVSDEPTSVTAVEAPACMQHSSSIT
jgi:hypothetical protein